MKSRIAALFLVLVLGAIGCGKLDKLTQFNIDYNESITIPANTLINLPITLMSPDVETNSEQVFSQNDTRADMVERVEVREVKLTISNPSGKTFSFLKSVEVYLNADGLPETKVAEKLNIPDSVGGELDLDVFSDDLSEFVKKEKFTIRVNTITDEALTSSVTVDIKSVFFVDAKVLGI